LPFDTTIVPAQQVGPIQGAPLAADVFTEPIAAGERMSDAEWQRVVAQVVVPPPSPLKVEQIIQATTNGLTWQERFASLSRKIASPEALAQQLITGYAQGENLQELTRRVAPLVESIQSSARRIARTEGLRVAESIQREAWSDLDEGNMLLGVQILAVLDQNTRPEHAARNGTIYFKNAADGRPPISELPHLPDAPNCRCWTAPVLRPPEEFKIDPAVQAAFANQAGANIPDPSAYDQWFARADEGRRKMAVGARNYNTMAEILGGSRQPEWTDFIQADGTLLTPTQLKTEAEFDRAARKLGVEAAIRQREHLLRQVAWRGFL
jgi:SPP1 gp7 family putative phage head morphogenesis protein